MSENCSGDVQEEYPCPSSAHSNTSCAGGVRLSVPVNWKVATESSVDAGGPEVIVVSGRVPSGPSAASHSYLVGGSWTIGSPSTVRRSLTPRTANSCSPSLTANATYGDVHGSNSAPSTAHSNVAFGSSAVKVKTACSSVLGAGGPCWPGRMRPDGPDVISATGADTISHMRSAGVGSTLPAMSTARIWKRWVPGSSESVSGELHGSNGPLLTEHSNSTRCPGVALSVPKNSNVASVSPVRPLGPEVMPVPGGLVSSVIVHS